MATLVKHTVTRTRPAGSGVPFWKEVCEADPALQAQFTAYGAAVLAVPGVSSFTRNITGDQAQTVLEFDSDLTTVPDIFAQANADFSSFVNSCIEHYNQHTEITTSGGLSRPS